MATVTGAGSISLPDGAEFRSPSLAAIHVVKRAGGAGARNGWKFWRVAPDGPILDELRRQFLTGQKDRKDFRVVFWSGFYEYCSSRSGFTQAFNDPADRLDNTDAWATFGIGLQSCELVALLWTAERRVGVQIHCRDKAFYAKMWALHGEIDARLAKLEGEIIWDGLDADKKTRNLTVRRAVDLERSGLSTHYEWMVEGMFEMRKIVMEVM